MNDSAGDPPPADEIDETSHERFNRNWNELLQEFRVLQTGTQILAGFLLTLPFQQRFTELSSPDRSLYLVLVILAAAVTLLALAPVTLHRLLFRQNAKQQLVQASNVILILCLALASALFVGIVLFVFDFVVSPGVGLVAACGILALVLLIWIAGPPLLRAIQRQRGLASS